jgi:hypothetical protein
LTYLLNHIKIINTIINVVVFVKNGGKFMRKFLFFSIGILMVSGFAFGADYTKERIIEFGGSASYSSNDVFDIFTLAPEVNYFVKDGVSVGGIFSYTNTKNSLANSSNSDTALLASSKYFFKVDSKYLYPYAGLLLNIQEDNNSLGISGGAKRTLFKNTLIHLGLRYLLGGNKDLLFFTGFAIYK